MRRRPWLGIASTVVVASFCATPTADRPERAPFPPDWPHAAPRKLNRELLLPETASILFIVDAPRGVRQPDRESLDHLARLAAHYGGRQARWVLLGESGALQVRWVQRSEPAGPDDEPTMEPRWSRDRLDTLGYLSEVPGCPAGALPRDTSYVFIRYLGQGLGAYGSATHTKLDASCEIETAPVI